MKKIILLLVCLFLLSCSSETDTKDYRNRTGKEKTKTDKPKTEKKEKKKKDCGCPSDSLSFYWNENLVLIDKEQLIDESNKIKIFLLHRLTDSTEYVELTSYDFIDRIKHSHNNDVHYVDSLYHSTNIGEKLFFEQIDRNRFFKVKK